ECGVLRVAGQLESHQPGDDYRLFQPGDRDLVSFWSAPEQDAGIAVTDDNAVEFRDESIGLNPAVECVDEVAVEDADLVAEPPAATVGVIAPGDGTGTPSHDTNDDMPDGWTLDEAQALHDRHRDLFSGSSLKEAE